MTQGEKIAARRKECGLSQEALAQQLGVSRQAVSKWETGDSEPESINLTALAQVFGVTVDWLLDPTASELGTEHIQKPKRKINWGYPLYLLGVALFFVLLIVLEGNAGLSFHFANLYLFFDVPLLCSMLIGCVLLLAVTGQMRAFGRTVSHAFFQSFRPEPKGKKAMDVALLGMVLFGAVYMICFTIHTINDMNDTFVAEYAVGVMVDMWLLFAFYIIAAFCILLPLRFRQGGKEKI